METTSNNVDKLVLVSQLCLHPLLIHVLTTRRKVLLLLILPLQQVLVVPPDPLLGRVQTLLTLSEPHGAIVVNSCSVSG